MKGLALIFMSILGTVTAFHLDEVYYEYHLQCDENTVNPSTTTCTFNQAKGDQNTVWHYEPAVDTRWSYHIKPDNINRVVFANCELPEIPKGLFNYYKNLKTVIAKRCGLIGIFHYTFKSSVYLLFLDLSYNNITVVKDKMFIESENLQTLDLSYNQIEEIEQNAFYGLKKLKNLKLQGNHLTKLHISIFIYCISLETLYLSENYIVEFDQIDFSKNPKLSYIDLSNNQIAEFTGYNLGKLTNLTVLNLSHNLLKTFSTEHFIVKKLYLIGNVIEVIYIFYTIEMIDVSDNQITQFNAKSGIEIGNLTVKNNKLMDISSIVILDSLKSLDLSNNPIGDKLNDDTFKMLVNLESLEMGGSNIRKIPQNIFANLKQLKSLDLSGNPLSYFDTSVLAHMKRIDYLYLDHTGIEEFNFNAIKHKFGNFSVLGISGNQFDCNYLKQLLAEIKQYHIRLYFEEETVKGKHIDYIECSDVPAKLISCDPSKATGNQCQFSNIQMVPNEHYQFEVTYAEPDQIESISFINSNIQEIPKGLFQYFRRVKKFYVIEVYIIEIYEYTFSGGKELTHIDMSNNKIKRLRQGIFIECIYLIELNLSNNEISEIDNAAFEGLSHLQVLNLNGNKLTALHPKVFYYLVEIEIIELQENQIDVIDEQLLANNKKLKELHLSNNKIKRLPRNLFIHVIEEVTLYIEYNKLKEVEEEIPKVKKVYLTGNELETLKIPRNTKQITLDNSNVKSIEVSENSEITELIIRNTSLKDISNLEKLKNLEILDLSHNEIQHLKPATFQNFKKLKKLTLHECHITTIETEIFTYLVEVEEIDLSKNKLKNFNIKQLAPMKKLKKLNLEYTEITEITIEEIKSNFPQLQEISLAGNHFTCKYLKHLLSELKKHNIKHIVYTPATTEPNVDGIACLSEPQRPMHPDVEIVSTHDGNIITETIDRQAKHSGQGPDIPAPDHLASLPDTCCEEIANIQLKVQKLEEEIKSWKANAEQHVEAMLNAKSEQIEKELKLMVEELVQQQLSANQAILHSRFHTVNYQKL